MTFFELERNVNELSENKHLFRGFGVTDDRIVRCRLILDFLQSNPACLREPYFPDLHASNQDNVTKGTWLIVRLVFYMTKYYSISSSSFDSPLTLPTDVVREILSRCDTTLLDVLELKRKVRLIEVEEMRTWDSFGELIIRA